MLKISDEIFKSIQAKIDLLKDAGQIDNIRKAGSFVIDGFSRGNKILIAGNGGSAADSQHFAAELAGRFMLERKGLPAVALTVNSSNLTAIANDFDYNDIFVRQLEALAKPGDIFFGISTSGNSKNLVKAMEWGRDNGLVNIGLLGKGGGKMRELCDISIIVPSDNTQNIQESHIMIIHILCQMVDEAFGEK